MSSKGKMAYALLDKKAAVLKTRIIILNKWALIQSPITSHKTYVNRSFFD